ncbi:transposase [Bradyrhizobium sp. UFLA05-153]
MARRYQVVRRRTRLKSEVHSILHAQLLPKCSHADLFNACGRAWLAAQQLPDDERAAICTFVSSTGSREDLALLDREIAQDVIDDSAVNRLMTTTGLNLAVAAGIVAAIGDISQFSRPQKLVSYFGLNPRVRQSGLGVAHHGSISRPALVANKTARRNFKPDIRTEGNRRGPAYAYNIKALRDREMSIAAQA